MKLLLDSHTWLWLISDIELERDTFRTCREAAVEGKLYLSPISLWEIGLKASRGRLDLPALVQAWLQEAVRKSRVTLAPFDFQVACQCATLPPEFHGDPADRILAATCQVHELTLLTRDRMLLALASQGTFTAERV